MMKESYYFRGFAYFYAEPNTTYTIRLINEGVKKMVEMGYIQHFSLGKIDTLYDKGDAYIHLSSIKEASSAISASLRDLRKVNALDFMNARSIKGVLKKFSTYQMVEMVIMIIAMIAQVRLVKRLFREDSILWIIHFIIHNQFYILFNL